MTSILSAPVYTTVVLGSGNYGPELLITDTGSIDPSDSAAGATGVYGNVAGVSVDNDGAVQGGSGYSSSGGSPNAGGAGGIGVDLEFGALANLGSVAGGAGGYSPYAGGGAGGVGVFLDLGSATNFGTLAGGTGGGSYFNAAIGGVGVVLEGSGLINRSGGAIYGGTGGTGGFFGGVGGDGADIFQGASLANDGRISGGGSGAAVRGLGGPAGIGVAADHANLINGDDGTIKGGDASNGLGGNGVDLAASSGFINYGDVQGGDSGHFITAASGGDGVYLDPSDNNVTNYGFIAGGSGGNSNGGSGGNGAVIESSDAFSNGVTPSALGVGSTGSIIGGTGGDGFVGGTGGNGVDIAAGGTVTNNLGSTIAGGAGGSGYAVQGSAGGNGGAGVYLDGGTLVTAGTIEGGAGGVSPSPGGPGASGDAILFGDLASTLVIDPGASFAGDVVANSSVNDVLKLAGTAADFVQGGVLSGLGTQFTGFSTVCVDAGVFWTLRGANTLDAQTSLVDPGNLRVLGRLLDAGTATIGTAGALRAGAGGTLQIGRVILGGGELADSAKGKLAVGDSLAGAQIGQILVDTDGKIAGFGTISGALLQDDGAIVAQGGTLVLATAVSGSGTIVIDSGAKLVADGALGLAKIAFVAGGGETLIVDQPGLVTSSLSGFGAQDFIDLKNLGPVSSLFFAGTTLTLYDGVTAVDTLTFAGSYTTANFTLTSEHNGGTIIGYHA